MNVPVADYLSVTTAICSKRGTAEKTLEAGVNNFGALDLLVNNAGIFYAKPLTEFTADDFNALASVNLLGFLHITQFAVKQVLRQKSGNVVTITGALADNPIAGVNASVSLITDAARKETSMSEAFRLGPVVPDKSIRITRAT